MRTTLPIAALVLLLSGVPAALQAGIRDFSSTSQARSFRDQEGSLIFSKDLSETAKRISFKVKLKVKKGAVRFRVENPHGRVMYQKRVPAEAETEWKDWYQGKRGEWRLVLVFEDATGRYGVKISTR